MLGSFIHQVTMLGVLLALTPGQIYAFGLCGGAFGLNALTDQHLGEILMALGGGLGYLSAGSVFRAGLLTALSRAMRFRPNARDFDPATRRHPIAPAPHLLLRHHRAVMNTTQRAA